MANTDSHYMIGRSHEVCQDYAASQSGFAALADGCSMVIGHDGKPMNAHTDIGARLLVRAAFHHQREADTDLMYRLAVNTADGYRRQLDLGVETLSATLLTLRECGAASVQSTICGDGFIAARRRADGRWIVKSHSFDGPPIYPRYCLCRDWQSTGVPSVTDPFTGEDVAGYVDRTLSQRRIFSQADFNLIVAVSDGAFSFTKNSTPIPLDGGLASRLLDFRGLKGRFVLRHLSGVLRELAEDGIVNQDDVSMVAMHIE